MLLLLANVDVIADSTDHSTSRARAGESVWPVSGGDIGIRWNSQLLRELGMPLAPASLSAGKFAGDQSSTARIAFHRTNALTISLHRGGVQGFASGSLRANDGYRFQLAAQALDFNHFELRPVPEDALALDLIAADGHAWLRLIRPMSEFSDDRRSLNIATMDVTISPALAQRIGRPETSGWTIGDASINLVAAALPAPAQPAATFNWPGDPAPNGGTYQADLFMADMSFQYLRCDACTGPGGSGRIVFAPTSKLRNNANTGTVQVYTVGGGSDPLGASTAMWPAGIAWYAKFSGIFVPYGNDQHPYLIWNMYRIDADGSIRQIGRSGVKHAFLTLNNNCSLADDHDEHVLGRGCEDTYSMSHNDNPNALSPRHEIVAATGVWGRCGSIYDPTCNGQPSASGNGNYDQRMLVDESQISEFLHPDASYLMESWYVTRDDINIYNSMATVRATFAYNGSFWYLDNEDRQFRLGPAIDRWLEPSNPGSNAANVELVTPEGHIKVAVKATYIGFQGWRYDYVFANMDFARADTDCCEPNLRVKANEGIREIRIPITGTGATAVQFTDADMDAGNDWSATQAGGFVIFTAPDGNRLNWGSLYSASFVSEASPVQSDINLVVALPGKPSSYSATGLLAPAARDDLFRSGFD